MCRILLGRGGERQEVAIGPPLLRVNRGESRLAESQCAGLVEGRGADSGKFLERAAVFDNDAVSRLAAHTGNKGNRCGNDEWTRRGHHQDLSKSCRVTAPQPADRSEHVRGNREGDGVAVGHAHKGGFGFGGFRNESNDALILTVLGASRDAHRQNGGPIHGPRHQFVSGNAVDRQTLAGQ